MALVVTDLYMPDMEGLELIRILRREQPGLPIVAISGGGTFQQRTALSVAERFGAVRVLEKPVDVATLQRVVGECLSAPRES
jgi:CheY-like chemotaxis protein